MTYTGDGLVYQGVQLVAEGPGLPLLLANTTTNPVGPTADDLKIEPVKPPGMPLLLTPAALCGLA